MNFNMKYSPYGRERVYAQMEYKSTKMLRMNTTT